MPALPAPAQENRTRRTQYDVVIMQGEALLHAEVGPLAGWSMLDSPTLSDLTEDELERVLRTWEG